MNGPDGKLHKTGRPSGLRQLLGRHMEGQAALGLEFGQDVFRERRIEVLGHPEPPGQKPESPRLGRPDQAGDGPARPGDDDLLACVVKDRMAAGRPSKPRGLEGGPARAGPGGPAGAKPVVYGPLRGHFWGVRPRGPAQGSGPQATSPGTPGRPAGRRPGRPGGGPHEGGDPAILMYAYTV